MLCSTDIHQAQFLPLFGDKTLSEWLINTAQLPVIVLCLELACYNCDHVTREIDKK